MSVTNYLYTWFFNTVLNFDYFCVPFPIQIFVNLVGVYGMIISFYFDVFLQSIEIDTVY